MEITTSSEHKTKLIGAKLGSFCRDFFIKNKETGPLILLFFGDLGSGKTTFIKGFVKSLKIQEEQIISPTFIIYQKFQTKYCTLYHFDLYRLNNVKDLLQLGFKDILKEKKSIILIEWADKIGNFNFKNLNVIKINLKHLNGNKRRIVIKGL